MGNSRVGGKKEWENAGFGGKEERIYAGFGGEGRKKNHNQVMFERSSGLICKTFFLKLP
ncbi:unnamed protein product [Onchocerca flexuosa]|uniref:Uncharacterized protein n=1 Tax=Onchocerca flexuosa TaxID=387005 RepID=A0A183HQK0_9BILA|nr:unnamed protein product [Onchocerca flexuosa]